MASRKGTYAWAQLPGMPPSFMWPVRVEVTVIAEGRGYCKTEVYCRADDAVFLAKKLETFRPRADIWKAKGEKALRKKPETFRIWHDDLLWVEENGAGVFRAYDAILELTRDPRAGLSSPDLIRTSNMRKYMATMVQAMSTDESQKQWIIDHLGHTMDVHTVHYRQTSDVLERIEVAKILLIQDLGLVGQFRGKRLEEIQLDEIMEVQADVDVTPPSTLEH
ncbi:uncharacterized protein [Argopecten irradians]|uniref:uncharacterized protein n=1 Tax=Argopecten irradians TaxID=31199 RepID=UPI00371E26AD